MTYTIESVAEFISRHTGLDFRSAEAFLPYSDEEFIRDNPGKISEDVERWGIRDGVFEEVGYELPEGLIIAGHPVTIEDSYGGEGKGDNLWSVLKIGDLGYLEISGYYSSWEGGTYDTIKIVYPHPVTKIVWKTSR